MVKETVLCPWSIKLTMQHVLESLICIQKCVCLRDSLNYSIYQFPFFRCWDFQIEHISNKIASSIFALSQIKNILQLNICILVYNSLVRPHIEYGIVTWGGGKNSKLQKIRSLQKKVNQSGK